MSDDQRKMWAEYTRLMRKLGALRRQLGIAPWERPPWWPNWENPAPPGTDEHAKWQTVHDETTPIRERCDELKRRLGPLHTTLLARDLRRRSDRHE